MMRVVVYICAMGHEQTVLRESFGPDHLGTVWTCMLCSSAEASFVPGPCSAG